jgi:hypothetical protein
MEENENEPTHWTHTETGNIYRIWNRMPMKMTDGSWVPGILYHDVETGALFVCSVESWDADFKQVKEG